MSDFKGSTVGVHVIADIVGIVNVKKYDNIEIMQRILHGAAKKAKLNVLGENWEKFQPQGLSGFLFLSESHISIHYTPEHNFMWIDVFIYLLPIQKMAVWSWCYRGVIPRCTNCTLCIRDI